MKYSSLLLTGLLLLSFGNISAQTNTTTSAPQKRLNVVSSPGLYNLALGLANEFSRLNPSISVTVTGREGKPDIEISDEQGTASDWKMIIGHDAIVPVINAGNPMLEKILGSGVTSSGIAYIVTPGNKKDWSELLKGENSPFASYIIDNDAVKSGIARFTGIQVPEIAGTPVKTSAEFISAIQKDRTAVGFCRFSDVSGENSNELAENIILLPIDRNGNRRIDYFEDIYSKPADFLRGVWIGKYPDELAGSIYITSPSRPVDQDVIAFLTWLVNDGSRFLSLNGYSELASIEKETALSSLQDVKAVKPQDSRASYFWLIIVAGLLTGMLFVVIKTATVRKPARYKGDIKIIPALDENSIEAPKGLFFDKTHTWAFMERDGLVRMGIDDFLQHLTGPLTRIKVKETGEKVMKGEKILTIVHEGKQLEIHSPVTGTIKSLNTDLDVDSSLVNSSPYIDGWIYLIEPRNWLRETEFLLMNDRYREWLRGEFTRLKDFFATAVRSNSLVYDQVVLQDGGQINDNVLADLGPEVWEDFQIHFIDTAR